MWVWSLGQEDPWSRKWQLAPVFLPGKFHAWRVTDHGASNSQTWLSIAHASPLSFTVTHLAAFWTYLPFSSTNASNSMCPNWNYHFAPRWDSFPHSPIFSISVCSSANQLVINSLIWESSLLFLSLTLLLHSVLLISSFSSVQSLSSVRLFATPWTTAGQASLSITNSQSPPKPMSIESVMSCNHLILCHPLLLLPSIFPSIRVFSNESALCTRWPKYWSFSFSISLSNEHPGLISFRMDRLDLLTAQGSLKSFLQHHSSKVSILPRSAFFIVQLSHPSMTTGKTIALTRWILLAK